MKTKKSIIIFSALIIAAIICSWIIAARCEKKVLYIKYTVSEGDTLWEIADKFCGDDTDIRDYIYEIRKANNLDSACINIGDVLIVPVK